MLDRDIIKNVFFDLDHTLWDFEKNSLLTFERVFEEMKIKIALEKFLFSYNRFNHFFWKLYRENKITHLDLRKKRLIHAFNAIHHNLEENKILKISDLYIRYLSTYTYLFDGAFPLLKELKEKYKLHIITNGFDLVQHHKIQNSGLSPYFDKIITAEKVGFRKPNPLIFKYAIEVTCASFSNSLMIGDSFEADILGAMSQGMGAIHFNSHNEPHHDKCPIVTKLEQIQNLI